MPGSILDMSTSTGAPTARARALGLMLKTKGCAALTTATPPTVELIATRKRRMELSTVISFMPIPD